MFKCEIETGNAAFCDPYTGEEDDSEIFQYYIISDSGAQILEDWTNAIVFYNEELDMYDWGVTHYGTAWSYVLTDIKLNCGDEAFN